MVKFLRGRRIRLPALLLALALLLCLSACGQADPVCGRWICLSAETEELSVPASLLGTEPVKLHLSSDGRGRLSEGQREGSLRWQREEGALFLITEETRIPCTLEDDTLLVELESGLNLRFARGDQAEQASASEAIGWYGWWEVSDSRGRMPDSWRDCCALLAPSDFGAELRLWDEDCSWAEPMAALQMTWDGAHFTADSGFFLLEDAKKDDWILDPVSYPLTFQGHYHHGDEDFSYRILLRPWGEEWRGEQRLPFRYNDWYLPLIDAGASMPERIG